MSASALMASLTGRGIALAARDGRLVVRGPRGGIDPAELDAIRRRKVEWLEQLAGAERFPPYPAELARWPIPDRQAWGELSNRYEALGLGFWPAQRLAFEEVRARREGRT